jgi:hypothetical protein
MEIEIYFDLENQIYFVLLWYKDQVIERYEYLDRNAADSKFSDLARLHPNAKHIQSVND